MKRAIILATVSSEEQVGDWKASIEDQESRGRQIAEQVVQVLTVPGHSRRFYNMKPYETCELCAFVVIG